MSMYDTEAEKVLEQWATSKYAKFGDEARDFVFWIEAPHAFKSIINWRNSNISDLEDSVVTFHGANSLEYKGTGDLREIVLKGVGDLPTTMYNLGLPTAEAGVDVRFGNQGAGISNHQHIGRFHLDGTTFYAELEDRLGNSITRDITGNLPADYDTAHNIYIMDTFKDRIAFWINGSKVEEIEAPHELGTRLSSYLFTDSDEGQDVHLRSWAMSPKGEFGGAMTAREEYFVDPDGTDWNGKSIGAGDSTEAIDVFMYGRKTIYFLSDTAGTLSVEVQEPDGTWRTYDTVSVSANDLLPYPVAEGSVQRRLRLSFDTAATVTAWISRRIM